MMGDGPERKARRRLLGLRTLSTALMNCAVSGRSSRALNAAVLPSDAAELRRSCIKELEVYCIPSHAPQTLLHDSDAPPLYLNIPPAYHAWTDEPGPYDCTAAPLGH